MVGSESMKFPVRVRFGDTFWKWHQISVKLVQFVILGQSPGLNSVDGIQNMGLGPNVTLITLNSEGKVKWFLSLQISLKD